LPPSSGGHGMKPGDIPSGPSEAGHDALGSGVATRRHHDGNRSRGLLGRQRRRRSPCHDHVDLELNQLVGQVGEPFSAAVGRAVLDHEVLALYVPVFSEPLFECAEVRCVRHCRHDLQHTDAVNLPRLLRLSGERRGEGPGQRGQQEEAAVHAGMVGRVRAKVNQAVKRLTAACSAAGKVSTYEALE